MNRKVKPGTQSLCLLFAAFLLSACADISSREASISGQASGPVKYRLSNPVQVSAGKEFDIKVIFDLDADWHIYAPTGNNSAQGMVETKVTFQLPEGIELVGRLEMPEPYGSGSYEVFYGEGIEMIQTLKATDELKAGKYNIKAKVRYQTCNPELCLPAMTGNLSAVIEVK